MEVNEAFVVNTEYLSGIENPDHNIYWIVGYDDNGDGAVAKIGTYDSDSKFIYCRPHRKRIRLRLKKKNVSRRAKPKRVNVVMAEYKEHPLCLIDSLSSVYTRIRVNEYTTQDMIEFLKERNRYEL